MAWTRIEPKRLARFNAREHRKQLREQVNPENWQKLRAIANGVPFQAVLPDGRLGPIQVPTIAEQAEAAKTLLAYGYGKPVPEDRIAHAEAGQGAYAQLSELSDAELAALERKYLGRTLDGVAGELPATVDAESSNSSDD